MKSYFSGTLKKRKQVEPLNNTAIPQFSIVEICEEGPDDDDQIKSNPFHFLQALFSEVISEIKNRFEKINSFKSISYSSLHRYLALQVFRI